MRKSLSECKNNVKEIVAYFEQNFQLKFTQFMGVYLQNTSKLTVVRLWLLVERWKLIRQELSG